MDENILRERRILYQSFLIPRRFGRGRNYKAFMELFKTKCNERTKAIREFDKKYCIENYEDPYCDVRDY